MQEAHKTGMRPNGGEERMEPDTHKEMTQPRHRSGRRGLMIQPGHASSFNPDPWEGSRMTTDLIAKRDALLASRTTDDLLDMLDVIQAGPRNEYGVLASAEHRTVSLWIIEEVERRHPDAVDYIERRMMELADDDPTPYSVLLREAVAAVGGVAD